MRQFIKSHIVEERNSPRGESDNTNPSGPVSAKRNIVIQLENKVSRLEDQLSYLTEYECKLDDELSDIKYHGGDRRALQDETIQRL